jgi:peptidylprolyl isomerase
MKKLLLLSAAPLLLAAQASEPAATPQTPSDVIAATTSDDWRAITPDNLLIMTLGNGAQVFIELAPDFAPVHVENIRTLARAEWFDGISVNRVQDNYVVQWGDATEEKVLPEDVDQNPPSEYTFIYTDHVEPSDTSTLRLVGNGVYGTYDGYMAGWPFGANQIESHDPPPGSSGYEGSLIHCYGMVGVGRGYNPDTGTGAELYTVIGHAPRHLDRNIALVGRVIEGIGVLSSLPRGTGSLGFYEEGEQRVPIASTRLASEMPEAERPRFEVMRTDTVTFRSYVRARANRTGWFILPAGAVDVCNVNLPIRRVGAG